MLSLSRSMVASSNKHRLLFKFSIITVSKRCVLTSQKGKNLHNIVLANISSHMVIITVRSLALQYIIHYINHYCIVLYIKANDIHGVLAVAVPGQ